MLKEHCVTQNLPKFEGFSELRPSQNPSNFKYLAFNSRQEFLARKVKVVVRKLEDAERPYDSQLRYFLVKVIFTLFPISRL